jgi:hypothetical protein
MTDSLVSRRPFRFRGALTRYRLWDIFLMLVKRPNAFKQYSLDARVQMLRFGDFVQEKEEPSVLLESWSLRILPFTVQMERGPSSPSL